MLLKRIGWFLTIFLAASVVLNAAPTVEEGKSLFIANCASCHAKDMKSNLTGPALGGVEERWSALSSCRSLCLDSRITSHGLQRPPSRYRTLGAVEAYVDDQLSWSNR
ncbi:MAG: c-type cytochrome [Lewinellaceae bacterium]|nr:c-type cytochrome [Lewinellaceae bacterium]